jgi:hypothetical protein
MVSNEFAPLGSHVFTAVPSPCSSSSENASGVGPASTFVVRLNRNESELSGVNDEAKPFAMVRAPSLSPTVPISQFTPDKPTLDR